MSALDKRINERYAKVLRGGTEGTYTQRPFVELAQREQLKDTRDLASLKWKGDLTKAILKDFRQAHVEKDVFYGMVAGRKNSGKTSAAETVSYWWMVTGQDAGRCDDPTRFLCFTPDQAVAIMESGEAQNGDIVIQDENPHLQGQGAQVTTDQLNNIQKIGRAGGISYIVIDRQIWKELLSLDWMLHTWRKNLDQRITQCYIMDGETHRVLGWAFVPLRPPEEWYQPVYWPLKMEFIQRGYGAGGRFSRTWDWDTMKTAADAIAKAVEARGKEEDWLNIKNRTVFETVARSFEIPGLVLEQNALIELAYQRFQQRTMRDEAPMPIPEAAGHTGQLGGSGYLRDLIAHALQSKLNRRNAERDAVIAAGYWVPDSPNMSIAEYVTYANLPVKKDMVLIILREARRLLTSEVLAAVGEAYVYERLRAEVHSQRELVTGRAGGSGSGSDVIWRAQDWVHGKADPGGRIDINAKLLLGDEDGLTLDSTPESALPDPLGAWSEQLPFGNKFLAVVLPRKCQERIIPIRYQAQVTSMSAKYSVGDLAWLARYLPVVR